MPLKSISFHHEMRCARVLPSTFQEQGSYFGSHRILMQNNAPKQFHFRGGVGEGKNHGGRYSMSIGIIGVASRVNPDR